MFAFSTICVSFLKYFCVSRFRSNININDVLGNYSLTLVDTLDTLLVFGNVSEFKRAVKLVIDNVSFEQDSTVQVFEANIRYILHFTFSH